MGRGRQQQDPFAAALTTAAHRAGKRVFCMGGDPGIASLDRSPGKEVPAALADVLSGRIPLRRAVVPTPQGPDLLPGDAAAEWLSLIRQPDLWRALQLVAALYDVFLVDAGEGMGEGALCLLRVADELVLAVTPDRAALCGAASLLKTLALGAAPPIRAVVVEADDPAEARRAAASLEAAARHFGLPLRVIGSVRRSRRAAHAARAEKSDCPDCLAGFAAGDTEQIARALLALPPERPGSFWQRLRNTWGTPLPGL